LATLHIHGHTLQWNTLHPHADRAALPDRPGEQDRLLLAPTAAVTAGLEQVGQTAINHPLLSAMIELPDQHDIVFTSRLSLDDQPWLADHRFAGVVVIPGAALVDLALWIGSRVNSPRIEELTLRAPLVLPEQDGIQLRVIVAPTDLAGSQAISI